MLALSRKKGEAIYIGQTKVVVHKISANRVTLAIDAPKEINIVREELLNKPKE
jgi:carbon storage regulator